MQKQTQIVTETRVILHFMFSSCCDDPDAGVAAALLLRCCCALTVAHPRTRCVKHECMLTLTTR